MVCVYIFGVGGVVCIQVVGEVIEFIFVVIVFGVGINVSQIEDLVIDVFGYVEFLVGVVLVGSMFEVKVVNMVVDILVVVQVVVV